MRLCFYFFEASVKILFICLANVCRSYMAQEILKNLSEKNNRTDIEAFSRGTFVDPELKVPKKINNFLLKNGITPASHIPTQYSRKDLETSDLILVMERYQYEEITDRYSEFTDKIYLLNEYISNDKKDVPDPIGLEGAAFEKVASVLMNNIKMLYDKLQNG